MVTGLDKFKKGIKEKILYVLILMFLFEYAQ